MGEHANRRGLTATAVIAAAIALVGAACGGDNSGSSSATTTASTATTAPSAGGVATTAGGTGTTGAGTTATTAVGSSVDRSGETITIGYVNNEGGTFSLPEFRVGGEVAIDAINKAGGVNGAQIKVEMCLSDATPEGSINCANKFVDQRVNLVYAGIDVSSDAMLPILKQADIPYVTSNSWGTAQKNDADSHILHAASAAFTVAPLKTLKDLGITKAAVIVEDTTSGQDFLKNVVTPIGEGKMGMDIKTILVNPANADYATAVGTAQASGAQGIWGQLSEPGCVGLATETNQIGFTGPVMVGSCTAYIAALKDKAVGTYTSTDLYNPEIASYAPPEIQARLKSYVDNMTAAGQAQYVNGFAVAPYSAMYELAAILETIPAGPIDSAAIRAAFAGSMTSPGYLGPDLHCAQHPWPTEQSHCRADILVLKVVKDASGNVVRQPVTPDFQNFSDLIG